MVQYNVMIKEVAPKYSFLFWDIKDVSSLSTDAIVERIINHGTLEAVRSMLKSMPLDEFKKVYFRIRNKKRCNLRPSVIALFDAYLQRVIAE